MLRKSMLYLSFATGLLALLVLMKLWVIPYLLWYLFPQNDLMSKIYEVLIMVLGGVTFLLFMLQGYIGKQMFKFHWATHFSLHFLMQLPFILYILFDGQPLRSYRLEWGHVFTQGWYGLLAEPMRLIFMVYHGTDLISIIGSFVFLTLGRNVETTTDPYQELKQIQRRIKVKS